ncbi:trafficking protein particle complex subunit 14-like isoform X2 [Tachypleus tridentatus]|uniref:trafficking protein particle complex subunit 14-like isoform X2 n=1 Tax=Tachypleus tridentatus TaxID=6853 RepID=UPI003FD011F6
MDNSYILAVEDHDKVGLVENIDENRNSIAETQCSMLITSRYFTVDGQHYFCINLSNVEEETVIRSIYLTAEGKNELFVATLYDGETPKEECAFHKQTGLRCSSWKNQFPIRLQPREQHSYLFLINFNKTEFKKVNKDVEIPLSAVLETEHNCYTKTIIHMLPSLRVRRPLLTMTAECGPPLHLNDSFQVKYTITNHLQDFLAIYLFWDPTVPSTPFSTHSNQGQESKSIICHKPLSYLGSCEGGSKLHTTVCFSATKEGVYEVGQHMKLKLHYRTETVTNTRTLPSYPTSLEPQPVRRFQDGISGSCEDPIGSLFYQSPVVLALDKIVKQPCQIYLFKSIEKQWNLYLQQPAISEDM